MLTTRRTSNIFVQVAATNTAPFNLDETFCRSGLGNGDVLDANVASAVVLCCSHLRHCCNLEDNLTGLTFVTA